MSARRGFTSFPFSALLLCGLCLPAAAATVLDDPVCVKTLAPQEFAGLKACLERGALCTKYWPTQADDLQKCDAATTWIRTAASWPPARRQELFGPDNVPEPVAAAAAPEPAWKRLPRSGNPSATNPLNIQADAGTNPYAGTSAAITPQAAEQVGWNVNVLTGVIKTAGQMAQDRTALQSPEAAAQAKEILGSVGLGEYAASDEAIAQGRKAKAAAAGAGATGTGYAPGGFIPQPESYPASNGGIPPDPSLPNAVPGAQGLCSLVRFKGAHIDSHYAYNTWHMEYDTSDATGASGIVQRVRNAKDNAHWFNVNLASEEMDAYACAMKFKTALNIEVADVTHSRRYRLVIPRSAIPEMVREYKLVPSSQGYYGGPGGYVPDDVRKLNSCDVRKIIGFNHPVGTLSQEPGWTGTKGAYFGAPIFAYEDTLKYLYAYRKFFQENSDLLKGILSSSSATREQLLVRTDFAIRTLECHKQAGYPFARENALAMVPAPLDDKEHRSEVRFTTLNQVPFER